MSPSPPDGLIENLRRLDPTLRLRWATHQHKWLIEVKARERQPSWQAERPSPIGTTPRALDWWEGWKDGYVYVTALAHPIRFPWPFIAHHLKHLSLEAHQAKDRLIERLDAAEAEQEASTKREWSTVNEAGAKELYDRLQWDNKREISTYVAGPNPHLVQRDGFTVYDRRRVCENTEHQSEPLQGPGRA